MNSYDFEKLSTDEKVTYRRLCSFKVPGMVDEYVNQLLNPNAALDPFEVRIQRMVDSEWQRRYSKKFTKYLKDAQLRYPAAALDKTIYDASRKLDTDTIEKLATCNWIDEGKNLLITGMSASGKTYLMNALCINALQKFKTVWYVRANTLIQLLEQSRLANNYFDYVQSLCRLDLLVIDDFGLMDFDIDKCRDLFEVIDGRDGRKSTAVISQLPVDKWYDLFQDATYAEACLSRLTDRHHSYRLEMNGENMRQR